MENEERIGIIEGLLEEGNYLAACLHLKDGELDSADRYDLTGRVAIRIMNDLASQKNREKIMFLRSILVWLFKDIPGLSYLYREQLRLASGGANPLADAAKGLQWLSGLFSQGAGTGQSPRDTMEDIKQTVEDAAEGATGKSVQDQLNEMLSQAGEGVEEGIRKAADFFSSLGGGPKPPPKDVSDEEKE